MKTFSFKYFSNSVSTTKNTNIVMWSSTYIHIRRVMVIYFRLLFWRFLFIHNTCRRYYMTWRESKFTVEVHDRKFSLRKFIFKRKVCTLLYLFYKQQYRTCPGKAIMCVEYKLFNVDVLLRNITFRLNSSETYIIY